jgi:hypothetical protein
VDDAVDVRTNPGLINAIIGIGNPSVAPKGQIAHSPTLPRQAATLGIQCKEKTTPTGLWQKAGWVHPTFATASAAITPLGLYPVQSADPT